MILQRAIIQTSKEDDDLIESDHKEDETSKEDDDLIESDHIDQ